MGVTDKRVGYVLAAILEYRQECALYGYKPPRHWPELQEHEKAVILAKVEARERADGAPCPR